MSEQAVERVEERPRIHGTYVLLPDPDGGHMVWPDPAATGELEYRLRYGPELTREQQLLTAAALAAYRYLFELPQRTRNQRISEIKKARTDLPDKGDRP